MLTQSSFCNVGLSPSHGWFESAAGRADRQWISRSHISFFQFMIFFSSFGLAIDYLFVITICIIIIMVGLWLSLNVLSFQTSLETWTTAAIINWTSC